jgi:hypothetical protein
MIHQGSPRDEHPTPTCSSLRHPHSHCARCSPNVNDGSRKRTAL